MARPVLPAPFPESASDGPSLKSRWASVPSLRMWAAVALDLVIAAYAVGALLALIVGGVDLDWISANRAAKPILILWVLVPIRLTLPFDAWTSRTAKQLLVIVWPGVRSLGGRVPAAVRDVLFVFAVTLAAAFGVGFLTNLLFPPMLTRPFQLPFERTILAETFAAWDSGWYFDIATRGYYYSAEGPSSVAFFPLYPMAMRAVAWPFGSSDTAVWSAGVLISITGFLVGLMVLHRLTEQQFDREVARRTVLYLAVFPFSFFLTRVYPAGLYFLLVVLAVSMARSSRWWLAGMCGALATLTRPHGILIGLPLGLMALSGGSPRQRMWRLLTLVPIPVAFAGYSLFVDSLAGHPLAWFTSQRHWGYSLGHPPWEQVLDLLSRIERYGLYYYFFTSPLAAYRLFHGAAALFFVAMVPAVFKRLGAPLGVWVLVTLLIPLSGNALEGIGRYGTVLFPVFMILGMVQSPRFHEALLIVWSVFLSLFIGLFVTWHPIY